MIFYVFKDDYESSFNKAKRGLPRLYESTSVQKYKRWFFKCLKRYGKIVTIDKKIGTKKLLSILKEPNAIFACVHGFLDEPAYDKIPRRVLRLCLGAFQLHSEIVYEFKRLPTAQALLVSTDFQIERLKSVFKNLMPKVSVFPPKVDTGFFIPPNRKEKISARKNRGIMKGKVHIVYAGRWLATKGICQLIRTLDIWPISNIVVTLAGNVEEGHKLAYSSLDHKTFPAFLENEILRRKRSWLRLEPAKNKRDLRELFWSADLFINPSIQPDENFGITPREAVSCGLPMVTTNFCGLYSLAESMPWKGLDTYPTISGLRFSLRQLRDLVDAALRSYKFIPSAEYRRVIIDECSPRASERGLKQAIDYLNSRKPEKPVDTEGLRLKAMKELLETVEERAFKLFAGFKKRLPKGAYLYGDGPQTSDYALSLIQGIYSAKSTPPMVEKKSSWRGFFRIAMWDKERAIIEFGFPGPRIKRYSEKQWDSLCRCSRLDKADDYVIAPTDKLQVSLVQELVDIGYFVIDEPVSRLNEQTRQIR